jgi:hypothetical protein
MTSENVRHEIERTPFMPLRLHLSSGKIRDIFDPATAWLQRNALLIVHRLRPGSQQIGGYDVIAFDAIERIQQMNGGDGKRKSRRR